MKFSHLLFKSFICLFVIYQSWGYSLDSKVSLEKGARIVVLGNGMASRMNQFGFFETELHLRHPQKKIF